MVIILPIIVALFILSLFAWALPPWRLYSYSKEVDDLLISLYPYVKEGDFTVDDYYMHIETARGRYSIWITNRWYAFLSRATKDGEWLYDEFMPSYATMFKYARHYLRRTAKQENIERQKVLKRVKEATL